MEEKANKYMIDITIKTWNSECNGIYNYKSDVSNIKEVKIKNNQSCYIIRNKSRIIIVDQNYKYNEEEEGQILFYVRKSLKDNDNFEIINPIRKTMEKNEYNINELNRRPWLLVKSQSGIYSDNEEYDLNENDIIKLGRRKYEIIKKNINGKEKNIIKTSDNPEEYNISKINEKRGPIFIIDIKKNQYEHITKKKENKGKIKKEALSNKNFKDKEEEEDEETDKESELELESEKCRICFGINSTEENPKIRLCSCHDFIHFECLKAYLITKTELRENENNTVKSYICNKFNCDVCRKPYPLKFRIPEFDRTYELIDLNVPNELDYIILESLDYMKDYNNLKNIHVVKLKDNEDINIGRYDTNDIIDTDISVSRKHAILKFNKETGKLHLVNLSEKFGTLILIKGNIKMKEKNIQFQVGKSFIQANLTKDDTIETNNNSNLKNNQEDTDSD